MKKILKVKGMHCSSCETIIEKRVIKIPGVTKVIAHYPSEKVTINFDNDKTNIDKISKIIEEKGYECSPEENSKPFTIDKKIIGISFGIIGLLIIGYFLFKIVEGVNLPEISQNMGYGLLFIVGLLTGFHCVSMCGGFVIGYTTKDAEKGIKPTRSHFMYGLGKTISYTIIGATFGLIGSIIAFTPMMRGVAGIIAGLFLIIFGLNMLNIFPWLRRIRIKMPKFINNFVGKETQKQNSPLIIGLLNGLMIACGPLQAIYIMAAGTGSMIEGAKLLFIFALGTLPVMIGFGFLTSVISKKATNKILKISGVIVIILGVVMMNRGLALTGTGFDTTSLLASVSANEITGNSIEIQDGYQVINMEVNRYGWEPNKFVLKKGVPVKWVINGKEINGCNNAIQVPKFGLNFDIKQGEQIIEFTPDQEGIISWSCWMGMIPGTFIVKENIDLSNTESIQEELNSVTVPKGGSCGMGGGCGCGGRR